MAEEESRPIMENRTPYGGINECTLGKLLLVKAVTGSVNVIQLDIVANQSVADAESTHSTAPVEGTQNEDYIPNPEPRRTATSRNATEERLKTWIRILLYSPVKYKQNSLWISWLHVIKLIVFVALLVLTTNLVFTVGKCRADLGEIIKYGKNTLQHTLLKGWDASYETLPYPPSSGPFAVYNIEDLKDAINFSVAQCYNAAREATGYFKKLKDDNVSITVTYFQLNNSSKDHLMDISFKDLTFRPGDGLTNETTEDGTRFSYNVMVDLRKHNLSDVFKWILAVNVSCSLHSIRTHMDTKDARCLRIYLNVEFVDEDHNGQVGINLKTNTIPISCRKFKVSAKDTSICEDYSTALTASVCALAAFLGCVDLTRAFILVVLLCETYGYMDNNFQRIFKPYDASQTNLPYSEYLVFMPFWDLLSVMAYFYTFIGTYYILYEGTLQKDHFEDLRNFDIIAVRLGTGCLLTWLNLLRYIKINRKFSLLFHTVYHSSLSVLAFFVCIVILFIGFWTCTFIVLGVYHIKFETRPKTAETLFSMINGDEIYATFAILQSDLAGDPDRIWWFSRIAIYSFVIIFTVLVFNLLIALFNSAYEVVKAYGDDGEHVSLGKFETIFLEYMKCSTDDSDIKGAVKRLLMRTDKLKPSEEKMKQAFQSILQFGPENGQQNDDMNRRLPQTIYAFINHESMYCEPDRVTTFMKGSIFEVSIVKTNRVFWRVFKK